jgi:uncharacterized protein with NRDE domain
MCLILIAHQLDRRYGLVVAANRDEFYERPTARAGWWLDHPEVLAGRDLLSGGTWMGVTRGGRFAAVTNVREPGKTRADAPSRGALVRDFLISTMSTRAYLEALAASSQAYNGFNLLVAAEGELWWFSNRSEEAPRWLEPGFYGLSNGSLDSPWPKVEAGKRALRRVLEESPGGLVGRLLGVLADRSAPADDQLPDTGVGLELERALGAAFIQVPGYGTRASHVVMFDRSGQVTFVERSFDAGEIAGERRFRFSVAS